MLCHRLAIGGVAIAFVLSQVVFWAAVLLPVDAFESASVPWLPVGLGAISLGWALLLPILMKLSTAWDGFEPEQPALRWATDRR